MKTVEFITTNLYTDVVRQVAVLKSWLADR